MSENTIIAALYEWFNDCPLLDSDSPLKVDYLSEEAKQYCIETVPTSTVIKKYTDGSAKCQYLFNFASREYYGDDKSITLNNAQFYEELEAWINEQSREDKLPALAGNLTPQAVEVNSSGYVFDTKTDSARYQIQCRLKYVKEV